MLQAMRKRMEDDKGFTLIELMVVVLIIAILIAIAIPTFLGLRQRAQDRAAQSDLRNGLTAAKAFFTDNDSYAPAALPAFDAAALEAIEPSLSAVDGGTPAIGSSDVHVKGVTGSTVVLVRRSASEALFCIADNAGVGGGTVRGDDDAATYADCQAAGPDAW